MPVPLLLPVFGYYKEKELTWKDHVGILKDITSDGKLVVIGRNQSNSVKVSIYDMETTTRKAIGFRAPNIPDRA